MADGRSNTATHIRDISFTAGGDTGAGGICRCQGADNDFTCRAAAQRAEGPEFPRAAPRSPPGPARITTPQQGEPVLLTARGAKVQPFSDNGFTRSRVVTIHEVAARAGVSAATVSRFLRGRRVRASAAIQTAVDELGYSPSAAAQSLKSGRTYTIGVVVPDITNPYFAAVVKGMESVTRTEPYRILLANSDESGEREDDVIADMVRRVDGIVLAPATEQDRTPLNVRDAGVPLVFVDRDLADGEDFDAILVDNAGGARQAAEHLMGLGHTRIAAISGPVDTTPGRRRREGFLETLAAAGIGIAPEHDLIGDFREQSGYQLTLSLLSLPEPPTAVFTANNLMTLGALKALHDMRVGVPDEISLIGFDDLDTGPLLRPPLTVIDRPMVEQGVLAMRLLLRRLDPRHVDDMPRRVVLGTKLVDRASTAPPRTSPAGTAAPSPAGRTRAR
ncbi:LacI family DNA-binding transcriptional regulator [Microbispora corallina]|uniref:LacI family DNA-binding transcriptional regulator n=1 Tax=Microbispora corallina TaxID=83302 RepID=UPI0031DD2869